MNKTLTVAGCRIPVSQDIAANVIEIKKLLDWATWNGVDIVLTPECALSGYLWAPTENDPRLEMIDNAIIEISEYSKKRKVDIILGTAGYHEGRWVNQLLFIVNGQIVNRHEKNLLIGMEDKMYAQGQGVEVFQYKGFRIAGLICNDAWPNPIWWSNTHLLKKLYFNKIHVLFIAANVPKEATHPNLMYNWQVDTVSVLAGAGNWNSVISDSSLNSDGSESSDVSICRVGITQGPTWTVIGHDIDKCYFKETVLLE